MSQYFERYGVEVHVVKYYCGFDESGQQEIHDEATRGFETWATFETEMEADDFCMMLSTPNAFRETCNALVEYATLRGSATPDMIDLIRVFMMSVLERVSQGEPIQTAIENVVGELRTEPREA